MDPFTALGAASSIVQLVQFGSSLASRARAIYQSEHGAIPDQIDCDEACTRLIYLSSLIKQGFEVPVDPKERSHALAIQAICSKCIEVSTELQGLLSKLRVETAPGNRALRKWRSFREALRSICSVQDIERLDSKLKSLKNDLQLHFVFDIKYDCFRRVLLQTDLERETMVNISRQQSDQMTAIQNSINSFSQVRDSFQIEDLTTLQEDQSAFGRDRRKLARGLSDEEVIIVQELFLNSLKFPRMGDRYEEISEAHRKTFEWVFRKADNRTRPRDNLADWLANGSGIYWISGKAGSGKSTLMRYIKDHEDTFKCLKNWSRTADLQSAAFFFWNSGTPDQRSYTGLLRSLLFEILRQKPCVIADLFPEEWTDYCLRFERCGRNIAVLGLSDKQWHLSSLKHALKRISDPSISDSNQFFLIDGLDEYDGDNDTMLEFLQELAASPKLKLCLSSRPWLTFQDSLEGFPCLRLQDLTFDDIRLYVNDKMEKDARMMKLIRENPEAASDLIAEIVCNAEGVFLWVKLVVGALLRGLRNRDDITDLRGRLRMFPVELEGFYGHMLRHIEPFYRPQAAKTFLIHDVLSRVTDGVCSLELEAAVTATFEKTLGGTIGRPSYRELDERAGFIQAYLTSRCAGLLEIHQTDDPNQSGYESYAESDPITPSFPWKSLKVNYIHQTAKEFLMSGAGRSLLSDFQSESPSFEPSVQVFMSLVARMKETLVRPLLKTSHSSQLDDPKVVHHVQTALKLAACLESSKTQSIIPILRELDRVLCLFSDSAIHNQHWSESSSFGKTKEQKGSYFVGEAVHYGLSSYVSEYLQCDNTFASAIDNKSQALLHCLLLPKSSEIDACSRLPDLKILEMLLRHGADPNMPWQAHTVWQRALTLIHQYDWSRFLWHLRSVKNSRELCQRKRSVIMTWIGAFELLLEHGADVSASCIDNHWVVDSHGNRDTRPSCHSVLEVIDLAFRKEFAIESQGLYEKVVGIMAQRR